MLQGGNTTLYVSDINESIEFYTERLGLPLRMRAGDHWAEIDAGGGMVIGLHPATPHAPAPGTVGAMSIGFNVTEPIEGVRDALSDQGVLFEGTIQDDGNVKLTHFSDPDGNSLYLCQVLHPGAHGAPDAAE